MRKTLVFGHLNPDADTTCSAIAYAWLLQQQGIDAKPHVLGKLNKETTYLLQKFEVETPALLEEVPADTLVAIVDTNNPDELPASIGSAQITHIIDHHKLVGGLSTKEPLSMTIKPVACTATLIWQEMQQAQLTPPASIAGLMAGAIVSDTLGFTSPTTTPADSEAAKLLAKIAGVELSLLAEEQSTAKSDLTGLTHEQILTQDSKIFPMGGVKVRISVLETTKPENALEILDPLLTTAKNMRDAEGLNGIFFFIVDITKSHATLVLAGDWEKTVAEKAFSQTSQDGKLELPGLVSRKKQMVPALENAIIALGL
jgi:manganese-dependent inorganic pyrophosphatase